MKLNKRLLVTSGLLLALSTIAMSTATYAWFTVNRTATASIGEVSVTTSADLEFRLEATGGQTATGSTEGAAGDGWLSGGNLAIAGGSLTDISGDGASFFKPSFGSSATDFASVAAVSVQSGNYIDAVISFRSSAEYSIYLGAGTAITESNSDSLALVNAARIAIFSSSNDPTAENLKQVIVTNDENVAGDIGPEYYYLSATTATTTTMFTVEDTTRTAATGYGKYDSDAVIKTSSITSPTKASDLPENQNALVTLTEQGVYTPAATGISTKCFKGQIRIREWIEGTDADCAYANIKGKFLASLTFITL